MNWYEKKFSTFFRQWEKGDLLLQDNQRFFGQVEHFEIADNFEDSTIVFLCYQPSGEERNFALKEIRHFHAYNGPILNIGKYVKIVKIGEQNRLRIVDGGQSENETKAGHLNLIVTDGTVAEDQDAGGADNTVICVAFGLEFYTNEKRARLLKQDAMQVLLSRFEESAPLLSVADHAPVDLTPTFTRWFGRVLRLFRSQRLQGNAENDPGQQDVSMTSKNDEESTKT